MHFKGFPYFSITATIGIAAFMCGCTQTKSTLGMNRTHPDEFTANECTTVDKPALSMPPSLKLAPPTTPTTEDKQAILNRNKAKALVLPSQSSRQGKGTTRASQELLEKAGATKNDPQSNIRKKVNQEAKPSIPSEQDLAQRILFWQKPKESSDVIDPRAESHKYQNTGSDLESED